MNTLFLSMGGSTIATLVAIGLLALFGIIGAIKGFANTFIKIFGTIFAVLIAVLLCAKVAQLLEQWFGMISFFSEKVSGLVVNIFGEEVTGYTLSEVADNETLLTSSSTLSVLLVNIVLKVVQSGAAPEATVGEVLSETFGYYISIAIVAVGLFIVAKILLWIIGKIITKLHKFKPFGITDRILGLALGLVEGLILVQVLTMVIGYIPISFFQELTVYIQESAFITFINNINVLGWIIKAFTEAKVVDYIKNALVA